MTNTELQADLITAAIENANCPDAQGIAADYLEESGDSRYLWFRYRQQFLLSRHRVHTSSGGSVGGWGGYRKCYLLNLADGFFAAAPAVQCKGVVDYWSLKSSAGGMKSEHELDISSAWEDKLAGDKELGMNVLSETVEPWLQRRMCEQMTVRELKAECEGRGVRKSGSKEDLIKRLCTASPAITNCCPNYAFSNEEVFNKIRARGKLND